MIISERVGGDLMSEYLQFTTTIFDWQKKALEDISEKTGIPQAHLIREAITIYLRERGEEIEKK